MTHARTIDSLIEALYDSISGPAGQERNWEQMRELFLPRAQMTKIYLTGDGPPQAVIRNVEEYIESATGLLIEHGFFEREIARRVDRFGHFAHVFSTYEARHGVDDPQPFKRGVNSIQLFRDGERWWITGMIWEDESAEHPLTKEFL